MTARRVHVLAVALAFVLSPALARISGAGSLPAGWSTRDIGAVGADGAAAVDGDLLTVDASGSDIWNTADEFRFVYTTLAGDGDIVARLAGIDAMHAWTKAGVMMRETLAPGSKHALMLLSGGKGLAFQRRTETGGRSAHTSGGDGDSPQFLKIERRDNTFTAYTSEDGTSWTRIGASTIQMAGSIYVGVAVTSHADPQIATARFTDLAVTAAPSTDIPDAEAPAADDAGDDGEDAGTPPPVTPDPAPETPASDTLRVLHWNTHHGGYGTDGRYDIDRVTTWIVKQHPDVVSLNEIEKKTGWGNEDQPAKYKALLERKTGQTWYMVWAQEFGNWSANGKGNLILSRFPWVAEARYELSNDRTVALGQIVINGRNVTFASTHLDPDSGGRRVRQAHELLDWLDNFAENRIVVGDMNAQATSTEINFLKQTSSDAWAEAKAGGFAYAAKDNRNGATRNSRIDFIFTSRKASALRLTRVEVIDARDSHGHMPSDHRPVLAVYSVR